MDVQKALEVIDLEIENIKEGTPREPKPALALALQLLLEERTRFLVLANELARIPAAFPRLKLDSAGAVTITGEELLLLREVGLAARVLLKDRRSPRLVRPLPGKEDAAK